MTKYILMAVVPAWIALPALAASDAIGNEDVTHQMCRAGGGQAIAGAMGSPGYCLGGEHDGKPVVRQAHTAVRVA
ncbi:hypothetical protein [Nocardia wallacei]|uniref:hypothetical protein n=1 Tax=Nocardia wallacei TaxID=480035 RepID=UPI0024583719|nr:hypothetical protein [Nocardia wallacei]